ncbi:MAG: protein kinase [bacterium]|nr:protein kinase [bacterium]
MVADKDRQLLFGALAVRLDLLSPADLQRVQESFTSESPSLDKILVEQKLLAPEDCELITQAVERHLHKHDGDASASIASPNIEETLALVSEESSLAPHDQATIGDATEEGIASHSQPATESRYAILREHAHGGLGQVYVARDMELDREVALKEIKHRHASKVALRRRFVLEAEVTGKLEHPGIVPVYGLGAYSDGRPYYAMRFIRGQSLGDAIDDLHGRSRLPSTADDAEATQVSGTAEKGDANPSPEPAAKPLSSADETIKRRRLLGRFVDVCNAIDYAHSRGVLHRDIKPDNIMLGDYGETLVVDWGLAKVIGSKEEGESIISSSPLSGDEAEKTMAGSVVGTPAFMSPEQANGELESLGPATDIYSLGATLFAMLSGNSPIEGSDAYEVLAKVKRGELRSMRSSGNRIPKPLIAICEKAMNMSTSLRYQSCDELAEDVEAYLAGEPVSAWREPLTVRAGRWMRKHRTLATSFGVGVSVLGVAMVIGFLLLGRAYQSEMAAHELADKRLTLGRSAVDKYLVAITEDPRLTTVGLEPLRKDLLESARDFYSIYTTETPNDPTMRNEQAWAWLRLAEIDASMGELKKSLQLYAAAAASFEELLLVDPDNDDYLEALGMAQQNRAILLQQTGEIEQARILLDRSNDQFKVLEKKHPLVVTPQRTLADNLNIQGSWAFQRKEIAKAEKAYREEEKLRRHIVEKSIQVDSEDLSRLGGVATNLGHLAMSENRFRDALKQYEEATKIYQDVFESYPEHVHFSNYHKLYSESIRDLADAQQALGDFATSLQNYSRSIESKTILANRHPEVIEYQQDLGMANNNLGTLYVQSGDSIKAQQAYEAAIDAMRNVLKQRPESVPDQQVLAGFLVNASNLYLGLNPPLPVEAEQALDEASAIYKSLAEREPSVINYRVRRVVALVELAGLYLATNRNAEAIEAVQTAHEIGDEIDLPPDESFDLNTAMSKGWHTLGMVHNSTLKTEQAVAAYDKAIALRRTNIQLAPENDQAKISLAASLANMGKVDLDAQAANDQTIERLQEAFAMLSDIRKRKPELSQATTFSIRVLAIMSGAKSQLGRFEAAEADLVEAMKLAPDDMKPGVKLQQIDLMGTMGRVDDLNRLARELVPIVSGNPWLIINISKAYALAAAAVKKDETIDEEKRNALAVEMGDFAVAFLNEAEKAGGFITPEEGQLQLGNRNFDAIRDREDFQEIMKKYQTP